MSYLFVMEWVYLTIIFVRLLAWHIKFKKCKELKKKDK